MIGVPLWLPELSSGQGTTDARSAPWLRLFAPFSQASFRLLVLLTLLPLVAARWGASPAAQICAVALLELALGQWLRGWTDDVQRRIRASQTVDDGPLAARVTRTAGWTALALAAICLAVATFAPVADLLPAVWSPVLRLHAANLPLAVTALACAQGLTTGAEVAVLRGSLAVLLSFAVLLAALANRLDLLAIVTLAHGVLLTLGGSLLALQRLGRRVIGVRLAGWTLNGAALAQTLIDQRNGAGWMALAAVLYGARAASVPSLFVVAPVLVVLAATAAAQAYAQSPELPGPAASTDPWAARRVAQARLDAAQLASGAVAVLLVTYGDALYRATLAKVAGHPWPVVGLPALLLAMWACLAGPTLTLVELAQRSSGPKWPLRWLAAESLVVVVGGWLAADRPWPVMMAILVAGRAVALIGLVATWWVPAQHAGPWHRRLPMAMVGLMTRPLLVALPALATGLLFVARKPPHTTREWLIQLPMLAILYGVAAFAMWNLRNRAARS